LEWPARGYGARWPLPPAASHLEVLTPRSLVAVLRAGYVLEVHPSFGEAAGSTTVDGQATTHDGIHQ
jgi:hypothetical protein